MRGRDTLAGHDARATADAPAGARRGEAVEGAAELSVRQIVDAKAVPMTFAIGVDDYIAPCSTYTHAGKSCPRRG